MNVTHTTRAPLCSVGLTFPRELLSGLTFPRELLSGLADPSVRHCYCGAPLVRLRYARDGRPTGDWTCVPCSSPLVAGGALGMRLPPRGPREGGRPTVVDRGDWRRFRRWAAIRPE